MATIVANSSALGDGDVLTIANELLDVAPRWELLARCLKLSASDIANIRTKYGEDVNLALSEVVSRAIATNHLLTWSDLVQALREPILNEEWCASQIEKKFVHKLTPLIKSVSSSPVLSQDSSVAVRSKIVPALGPRDPLISPYDSIDTPTSPSKLFICRDDEVETPYSCGCGECQSETFDMKLCINPLKIDCHFPYMNMKHMSDGERESLESRLREAFLTINREYAKFTHCLRKSLVKRNVTPKELADVLMDVRGYVPLEKHSKRFSLLEDRYEELRGAEDIAGVFVILRDYSSFFNHDLIAFIADMVGTEKDQRNLALYQEKFAAYCKRHNIFECPSFSSKSNKLTSFVLKVDQRMSLSKSGMFTAESLLHFKSKVAEVFDVTKYSLKLCSVQEGCLEILIQTPVHVKDFILSRLDGKQLDLCSLGIQKLCFGHKVISTISPSFGTYNVGQKPVSYTPARRSRIFPSQSSICVWYRLSGSCKYGDKCSFRHITPHKSPAVGNILVPEDCEVSDEMFSKIYSLGHSKDYVVVHKRRKIIAEDNSTLQYAQRRILRYLQSISAKPGHSFTRLNYTYFHPEGVELAQLYEFRQRKERIRYEVHKVLPKESVKKWSIEEFDYLNKEYVARTSVYSQLKRQKKVEYPIIFRKDYKEDIQHRLEDGLRWMYEEGLIPMLEGRFGKIIWKESSGDQIMDVDKLAKFASTIGSDGLMFFTELDSLSPAALKKTCLSQIGFKDETYLFTLKARRGDESYRIRVKVENGRPKIVYVRQLIGGKNRAQLLFDILCLHRKYDIRLSLQSEDKASTHNPSVERFVLSSIEILESGGVRYDPFATNEKWSVMHVRHQQWESFVFHKHYTVSISAIGSYNISPEKLKPLVIRPEDFSRHHEVELHCSLWEDLDTHSTDDFVNPHADLTPKDSEQWTPKKIVEEFEKNDFLQIMDGLNKAMELVPVQ